MTYAWQRRGLAAALLLAAFSTGAQAQFNPNDPNAGPPPADAVPPPGIDKIAHTVEAFKKEGGVTAEVWTALEAFRPADVDEKHKKGPKQIETSERARNMNTPDTYITAANKSSFEPLGGGYRSFESSGDAERAHAKTTGISFMGLFQPVAQREMEIQIRSLFLNAPAKTFAVFRVTGARLPPFEDAVKPGAAWNYELDSDVEVFTQVRWAKRERKFQFKTKNTCTNGERSAATVLHAKLSGAMVPITCKTTGQGDDATNLYAYVEDYGVFIMTGRKTAKVESEFLVQVWE